MRTGQVVGSTNRLGEHPENRPVHYCEVFATLYHNMGIDARNTTLTDLRGRPNYLVDDRRPIAELLSQSKRLISSRDPVSTALIFFAPN